ncbi:putative methyltransferase domain-containing protein [Botrytis fragariae]|uniref:Putative methyltransferase domain-containing protein n=1 Tax=Botrytis fragariae TaxID=1964551 RepID=A0A8H6B5S5_9HELO|nr:putative methyltransferase domain-containing protein [Botrytis fragariae]KAF5879590.1 putative methyltransferase domain-containing protein [Botrytis fragariae]
MCEINTEEVIIGERTPHELHDELLRVNETMKQMLSRTSIASFLDIDTCIGQAVPALYRDGVPLTDLSGTDTIPEFEAAGHPLFRDQDRFLPEHHVVGDILNLIPSLASVAGTWPAVNMNMFLHLFNPVGAEQVCTNILNLLHSKAGSLLTGTQTGIMRPGKLVLEPPVCEPEEFKTIYWNSAEKLIEMWQRVAKKLSINIKTTAEYDEDEDPESSDSSS